MNREKLISRHDLEQDPWTRDLQERAVSHTSAGETELSRTLLCEALRAVGAGDLNSGEVLTRARLLRDYGFTYVRDATRLRDVRLAEEAVPIFEESAELTEALMQNKLEHSAFAYISAEHGATISVEARDLSVQAVLSLSRVRHAVTCALDDRARETYFKATTPLWIGDNPYYRVSNDANAMRHNLALERRVGALGWLTRGAGHTALSLFTDPQQIKPVAGTLVHRLSSFRSSDVARESILTRP